MSSVKSQEFDKFKMIMEEQKKNITQPTNDEVIDLREVFTTLWSKKKTFIWVWIITVIVSAALIFPVPRYYASEVKLAPEMDNSMSGGALGSIASSFGFDLGNMQTTDAIYPMLYPELLESNDFVVELLNIPVTTDDGEVSTDYYHYLKDYQETTVYMIPFRWLMRQIRGLFKSSTPITGNGEGSHVDPFRMSEEQKNIVDLVHSNIACNVDMKTQVISIKVQDQDPLICATMADSIRQHLQNFIISYRTSKASNDVRHYEDLTSQAKADYERSMAAYGAYCDANRDIILQSAISKRDELENAIQINLTKYNTLSTQLEAAKAKLQERIPAFTLLQGATVPTKPAGPKRLFFIIAMLFLTTLVTGTYILRKQIVDLLLRAR